MTIQNHKQILGKNGEDFGIMFLQHKGHVIIARNWRGKYGELDIVSMDGTTLVFTEVKTRRGQKFGSPQSAVTLLKQKHLCLAALEYITANGYNDCGVRFDVLALIQTTEGFKPEWIANAFEFMLDEA